jgi:hypothetical protein
MTELYCHIYLVGHGYVVYRDLGSKGASKNAVALTHKVATFVTQVEATHYCRVRNQMVERFGTDAIPSEDFHRAYQRLVAGPKHTVDRRVFNAKEIDQLVAEYELQPWEAEWLRADGRELMRRFG